MSAHDTPTSESLQMGREVVGMARDHVFYAIKRHDNVAEAVGEIVQNVLSHAAAYQKALGATPASSIESVAAGAIHGAIDVGADLVPAGHGIMLGIFCGPQAVKMEILPAIQLTAQAVIRTTASVGGNVEAATRGLVAGVIVSGMTMDIAVPTAVAAVVEGALAGAGQVAPHAVESVQQAISVSDAKDSLRRTGNTS